jgi:hypothetical protein
MLPLLHRDAAGLDIGAEEISSPNRKIVQQILFVPSEHSRVTFTSLPMVADMPRNYCGDGVDRCPLNSCLSDPGAARHSDISGQRSTREERARQEERCVRLSVDPVSPLGWTAESELSPT